jgi:hypothetical protein
LALRRTVADNTKAVAVSFDIDPETEVGT